MFNVTAIKQLLAAIDQGEEAPFTTGDIRVLLHEAESALRWQGHARHLRDAMESIGSGSRGSAETVRAQCRLLVKAFDSGVNRG